MTIPLHFLIMEKGGVVYILTNKNNSVLYTGVTSNLKIRLSEHIEKNTLLALQQSIILIN